MTTEVSKNLMCICIRGGIEIWVEKEKIDQIIKLWEERKIFTIEGNVINPADISGIFDPLVMEERTRRKNGQWKGEDGDWHNRGDWECKYGAWHEQYQKCGHTNSLGYKD